MSPNMQATLAWLRSAGFMCAADCERCRLVVAMRGAIAALSQPRVYPGDIALARSFLERALATPTLPDKAATDRE